MDGYLIIGCGHFGSRAAKKLFQRDSNSKIIVVDKSRKALQRVSRLPIQTVVCDGISYLNQFLSEGREVNYIIPAVPFHLAFEFILSQLNSSRAKRRKLPPLSGLPNPVLGKTSDLYTSFADFLCPEDCPEPAQYCFTTKKKRLNPLYQILNDMQGAFESRVIRSHQLTRGVGGFQPEALLHALEDIKRKKKRSQIVLISTASRCHGVTSALSF
jgi:hypothetical protein